jgi:putative transposase
VLVILAHERRRVVHVAVTDHPTAAWTAQQLREAFPWNEAPRYLVHDRDAAFSAWTTTAAAIGVEEILTAPRSPWQNAYAERLIGSIRRECLEHIIIMNEPGLRRTLAAYVEYYLKSRTHLALNKDAPVSRSVATPADGHIVAIPCLGGLHHRYERRVNRAAHVCTKAAAPANGSNSGPSALRRVPFGRLETGSDDGHSTIPRSPNRRSGTAHRP